MFYEYGPRGKEHFCRLYYILYYLPQVINNTIQKDLKKITEEGRQVEKDLRAERVKLIREKIKEAGGDVSALNDAGRTFDYFYFSIILLDFDYF